MEFYSNDERWPRKEKSPGQEKLDCAAKIVEGKSNGLCFDSGRGNG
jgi:hypothetical protein